MEEKDSFVKKMVADYGDLVMPQTGLDSYTGAVHSGIPEKRGQRVCGKFG